MSGDDFICIKTPVQILNGIGFPFGELNQQTGGKKIEGVQVTSVYGEVSTVDIQFDDNTILRYEWTGSKYAQRETKDFESERQEKLDEEINREKDRRSSRRSTRSSVRQE